MYKAVLFDLDMTLIDFIKMKHMSCEAAIEAMIDAGLAIKRKEAKKILFGLYDKHGIEHQLIFQEFLKEVLGRVDYKLLANAITAYRKTQASVLKPYPGTKATLLRLREKGLKLGIVSDAPRMRAWLRLAEMGLTDFFDVVVTLDDTGKLKPDKIPFEAAVKKLGVDAGDILFVGDNPERDIKGAKQAGMGTALAKYGQWVKSNGVKADHNLKQVSDVLRAVEH